MRTVNIKHLNRKLEKLVNFTRKKYYEKNISEKRELNTFLTKKVLKRILKNKSKHDLCLPNALGIRLFLLRLEFP